ncbi:DNA damage-regulated autophagy modulator protein 2-like isoform X1 [Rhodnius prolixus]|uniref:Putative dna damage-regulated autophagy modulator protein 2-like cimex lectularius n=2 Tax=Rhodnius prolixus TaxID=13249 RepID=A0A4P6D9Q7_RHOPR
MAKKKHLHILPTLVCLVCPLTFVITFIVAWQMGHVSLAFPYISDTGNYAPESCIFSQLLNITSMLLALCVYIRYLQVKQFANFRSTIGHRLSANNVATLLGYLSCLGMDIVANFQVKYVWQIHYIGACLCFIGGTVYFIFQTFFSYYLSKKFDSGFVFYARSILCFLSVLMTIAAIVPGVVSGYYYTGDPNQETHWRPEDGGYILHIISTGSEWILALTQCILVLTFLPEFKNIHLFSPKLKIEGINDT